MDIETCMRGFSFMPKNNVEHVDLKYVEKDALEQTWRSSRRERLKQQEQRVWEEFVQERDIVSSVCKDDPYQFLHQLPETCLKELLEVELQRMRKEQIVEEVQQHASPEEPNEPPATDIDNQHVVTFVEDSDKEEMFHIFDDEKEDDISGPEEEVLNDSAGSPPCTVRERESAREKQQSPSKSISPDKASSKSSENVTYMIESSIYCAKVRDLRMKINDELLDIIATLDRQDITKIEPEEVPKIQKRSAEFSTRFNRIHMYQLQRQVHDIERHNGTAPPFARHTHFQAQMGRIASLHQSFLQAAQIFHKSVTQTACIRESGDILKVLLRTIIDGTGICRETSTPSGLTAAKDLYTDDVQESCNKLEESLNEYSVKLSEYLDNFGQSGKSKKGKHKGKERAFKAWSKSGTKSGTETDARLSMYSLDTLRLNLNSKSSISKDHSSGTSKVRGGLTTRRKQMDKGEAPKSQRKSPRSRRPLMRDPAAGKPRRKQTRDLDVSTLVETVTACASSHISREDTPLHTPRESKDVTPRRHKDSAKQKENSRKPHNATPHRIVSKSARSGKKSGSPTKNVEETPKLAKDDSLDVKRKENGPDNVKTKTNDIKVELKPKSPEKLMELSPKALKPDTSLDSKHACESPKSKHANGVEIQKDFAENVLIMDRELSSPRHKQDGCTNGRKSDRDRNKTMEAGPGSYEVSRLLRQLCGGDAAGNRSERVSGAKNAQLLCVNGSSPRQPSTPQLLRILEETIQKKAPKPLFPSGDACRGQEWESLRLPLRAAGGEGGAARLRYRGQFVQHMLASAMYANGAVPKPWEAVASISDQIIDELLLGCVKEMELKDIVQELYLSETR